MLPAYTGKSYPIRFPGIAQESAARSAITPYQRDGDIAFHLALVGPWVERHVPIALVGPLRMADKGGASTEDRHL